MEQNQTSAAGLTKKPPHTSSTLGMPQLADQRSMGLESQEQKCKIFNEVTKHYKQASKKQVVISKNAWITARDVKMKSNIYLKKKVFILLVKNKYIEYIFQYCVREKLFEQRFCLYISWTVIFHR